MKQFVHPHKMKCVTRLIDKIAERYSIYEKILIKKNEMNLRISVTSGNFRPGVDQNWKANGDFQEKLFESQSKWIISWAICWLLKKGSQQLFRAKYSERKSFPLKPQNVSVDCSTLRTIF